MLDDLSDYFGKKSMISLNNNTVKCFNQITGANLSLDTIIELFIFKTNRFLGCVILKKNKRTPIGKETTKDYLKVRLPKSYF